MRKPIIQLPDFAVKKKKPKNKTEAQRAEETHLKTLVPEVPQPGLHCSLCSFPL